MNIDKDTIKNMEKMIFSKINDFAAKNNLKFSYTFDLRAGQFNENKFSSFTKSSVFKPEHRSVEICNYLEYAENKDLQKNKISLHLTRYFEAIGKYKDSIMPGLPATGELLADQNANFYDFIGKHKNNISTISLHLGGVCTMTDSHPLDWHLIPAKGAEKLSRAEAIDNAIRNINIFKENCRNVGYTGDILLETLDYHLDPGSEFSAYEYFAETEVVKHILDKTGCKILLDIAHVMVTQCNLYKHRDLNELRKAAIKYVDHITDGDYGKIKEVHFLVPLETEEQMLDLGIKHHNGQEVRDVIATMKGTREFSTAVAILKHIIAKRDKVLAPFILNFESAIEFMNDDMEAFLEEYYKF